MRIEKTNFLSEKQINNISNLEKIVFCNDDLQNHAFLSNEISFNKTLPCFYMGYENNELVAFLTTFMPTSYEAEILAVTHPDYRKKGYFKELFHASKEVLQSAGINKILFVIESKSKNGTVIVKKFEGAELEHSEYRMSHDGSKVLPKCEELNFTNVTDQNKEIFTEITRDAFPDLEEDSNFIDTVVCSENREGYIAYKDGIPIGVFDLNLENGDTFLYGVGVKATCRGKGYGKKIVGFAVTDGLKKAEKVVLDVDSKNPTAFNLYKKCGFMIDFQVDYYRYGF